MKAQPILCTLICKGSGGYANILGTVPIPQDPHYPRGLHTSDRAWRRWDTQLSHFGPLTTGRQWVHTGSLTRTQTDTLSATTHASTHAHSRKATYPLSHPTYVHTHTRTHTHTHAHTHAHTHTHTHAHTHTHTHTYIHMLLESYGRVQYLAHTLKSRTCTRASKCLA